MKLIIAGLDVLDGYISREFSFLIRELIANFGWRHLEPSRLWVPLGSLHRVFLSELGAIPEVILFWEQYELLIAHLREINDLGCHKCMFADDLHWWGDRMKTDKRLGFALSESILSPYAYQFGKFYPELAAFKDVRWVPHSACEDFMLTYEPTPEQNGILLSGAIDSHYYPLRHQMLELSRRGTYPITLHPHPGYYRRYDHAGDPAVGAAYARKINQHRAAFVDCLKYGYIVAKYFEIPATGCLMLAEDSVSDQLRKLGFIDNVHYIGVSSANLEDKIRFVLGQDNWPELDAIRSRAQLLVRQKHRVEDRAKLIDQSCRPPNR